MKPASKVIINGPFDAPQRHPHRLPQRDGTP